jgi:hypothetical protein
MLMVVHIQCTNRVGECHWTYYHTDAYEYADAQALLSRVQARMAGLNLAPVQPAALRAAQPTPPRGARVECNDPDCTGTKKGNRSQGSRACIEYKCKKCCQATVQRARLNGMHRDECTTHSQPAVHAVPALAHRPNPEQVLIPHQQLHPILPPQPPVHVPVIDPALVPPATQPLASNNHTEPVIPYAPARQHAPVALLHHGAGNRRRQGLAQPLAPSWSQQKKIADQEKQTILNLKATRQEMDERLKRTCTIVWWYEVSSVTYMLVT